MKPLQLIIFCAAIIQSFNLPAQQNFKIKEIGVPNIEGFTPEQYNGGDQVWGITQDQDGIFYVASGSGISQYDGKYWRKIATPGSARSILNGSDGKVYVGWNNGVGVLVRDSTNTYIFKSLVDKIPMEYQKMTPVHEIVNYRNNIIFLTQEFIYIYDYKEETFDVLPSSHAFVTATSFDDRLLIFDYQVGLVEYINGSLELVPYGEQVSDLIIYKIIPQKTNEFVLLSTYNGLFKFNEQGATFWDTEFSNFVKDREAYKMIRLNGGYLAIGTTKYGVFIIDKEGKIVQKLNKQNALLSDIVYSLYQDRTGMLWVGMYGGINYVHVQSPFSFIGEKSGLMSSYLSLEIHKNVLYICGQDGIYKKDLANPWQSLKTENVLEQHPQHISGASWTFIKKGEDLFCGTETGLFLVKDESLELIANTNTTFAATLKDPNSFIVASDYQLALIRKEKNRWKYKWVIKNIEQHFHEIFEIENGELLGSDIDDGVFRIKLNDQRDSVTYIRHYTEEDGLPSDQGNSLIKLDNEVVTATVNGVFKLDLKKDKFLPYEAYSEFDSISIHQLNQDHSGNIFLASSDLDFHYLKKSENPKYSWNSESFKGLKKTSAQYILPVDDQNVFIIPSKGLLHYDPSILANYDHRYATLIRKVSTTTEGDSLIFGGVSDSSIPTLLYADNALNFEFSAAYYDRGEELQFQYYLDGFENDWSEWTKSTEKEYTNLPHGNFDFLVKSKNIYGYEGDIASFKFSILPPWYFTVYAYTGYAVLFVLFVWVLVRLNSRRLINEKNALEKVVQERTAEIREQKNSIEKQAKKLQELDKVKSRFFANISHELRTPITLINGPIDAALNGDQGKINAGLSNLLNVARKNGKNLLVLVNEIMDLTKLEAGKLKLIENPVHLHSFLTDLLEAYESEILIKKIDFQFIYQYDKEVSVFLDEAKFGKIVNNLLSNAFKFTPDLGKIQLIVKSVDDKLVITVKDNGQGIHLDDIERVFDRFYQSEQPEAKAQGGTGIGLALSQELAKLHNGTLSVSSELEVGSEFTFMFTPNIINSEAVELVEEEINIGLIKTDLDATISNYIDVFAIQKPVLLLIEDHTEMREFIAQIIRPYFVTLEAKNGIEGLELLENNQIDMIISDVMMPKMDGFELLEKIKSDQEFKDISVIMLTARTAEEDKLFALTLGVDDYLTKPFNHEELLIRTKNILDNRVVKKLAENAESLELERLPDVDIAFVDKLRTIVEKNINDSLLSVSFLASEVAMSRRQLLRKLKVLTGYSPVQFIKEVRLQKAKSLLENHQVNTVAEASYSVGIDKVKYFSNQYINRFGKRPSDSLPT